MKRLLSYIFAGLLGAASLTATAKAQNNKPAPQAQEHDWDVIRKGIMENGTWTMAPILNENSIDSLRGKELYGNFIVPYRVQVFDDCFLITLNDAIVMEDTVAIQDTTTTDSVKVNKRLEDIIIMHAPPKQPIGLAIPDDTTQAVLLDIYLNQPDSIPAFTKDISFVQDVYDGVLSQVESTTHAFSNHIMTGTQKAQAPGLMAEGPTKTFPGFAKSFTDIT